MGKEVRDFMKLELLTALEMRDDNDTVLMAKLLSAHQALRNIEREMKDDSRIKQLQKELDTAKRPYKLRLLRQKNIVAAAELVAKSRGIHIPEEDRVEEEDV